jgi:hypothetical protein
MEKDKISSYDISQNYVTAQQKWNHFWKWTFKYKIKTNGGLCMLTKVLMPFVIMYMFVNYISTKYINAPIHQGLNPKTSWKHTKVLTTKPLQNFINKGKKKSLLCLAWHCLKNSNFKIHFFFQNLFKCYKWKHDLKLIQ